MLTNLITFGLLFLLALVVIVSSLVVLGRLGDSDRASDAGWKSLRWLMVGAVIASISDAFSSGEPSRTLLPFALAFATLTAAEYFIQVSEEKAKFDD